MSARFAAIASVAALAAACVSAPPPQSASYADYLIGRIANQRDDYPAAADRYFAALQRAPHDRGLIEGALLASLAGGDVEAARRAARMAPRQDAPAYADIIRGAEALRAGRWNAAASALEDVEGAATQQLAARMVLVWARAAQGRLTEVNAELEPMMSIRPYGALFAYQQAMALDFAGRGEEALQVYARAADGGMWLPSGVERRADLMTRLGDRDGAMALLNERNNRANPALAAALARLEAGEAAASETLTPARGAASGLYGLAAIYLQEHDTQNGLAALTLARLLDPDFDAARLAFAQAQSTLGNVELARASLNGVGSNSPYAGSARMMEAWVLLGAEREDEALSVARAAADNGAADTRRSLADMYRNLNRFEEAEPIYSELIGEDESDWRLHFSRGVARERLGRWDEAEADLQRALELSPDQPDVLNYLGYTWVDRGENLQEGLRLVERAAELRPQSGAIIDSLGWAHYRLGDYDRALLYLERAVELAPSDPTLNDHLGDVYWRLGRRIEARFQWEHALMLEPDQPDLIETKLERGLAPETAPRTATR